MAKTIANLNIQVGAPTTEVKRDLRRTSDEFNRFDGKVRRSASGLNKFGRDGLSVRGGLANLTSKLKVAAVQFLAVSSAIAAVQKAVRLIREEMVVIDEISKLSDQIGFTTEELVAFRLGAELSGVEVATLNRGLTTFVRRVGLFAEGTGAGKKALENLGFSAERLVALDPGEAFKRVAEAISRLPTAAQRGAAAFGAFGNSGQKLLTFIANGRAGLEEFQKQADQLNLTFSRDEGRVIETTNDSLTLLSKSLQGLVRELTVIFGPRLQEFLEETTEFVKKLSDEFNRADPGKVVSTAGRSFDIGRAVAGVGSPAQRIERGVRAIFGLEQQQSAQTQLLHQIFAQLVANGRQPVQVTENRL